MAQGALRRLARAEPQRPADLVPKLRPSPTPASGLRLGPRGARALRGAGYALARRARRPTAGLCAPPRTLPAPAALRPRAQPCPSPALTSLQPQVPGTQLVTAPASSWAAAPGGGAPAPRLFPTCARAAGPGGGAGRRGRGSERPVPPPAAPWARACRWGPRLGRALLSARAGLLSSSHTAYNRGLTLQPSARHPQEEPFQ